MIRSLLWIVAGLVLGIIIHLVVILSMPSLAINNLWLRIRDLGPAGEVVVLDAVEAGQPDPLQLDPEFTYAICRFDLSQGPGLMGGEMPPDFWSVGVFDSAGKAVYSTTNRSGVGTILQLGLFNAAQTRLLAEQQFEIQEGMLIIEAPVNEIFAVIRLSVPHPVMWERYHASLANLDCGHITNPAITSGNSDQG